MQNALLKPFTGDWDAIKQRRFLRALVVYSRTLYYVDRGQQRGASYEVLKAFEDEVNAKLKTKTYRFQVIFIPVSRDELIPALLDGRGDLAAANLTITPERERLVDFTAPLRENVTEVVVTGPSGPKISTLDDLSGMTVHARRLSSYWEHLEGLNQRLVQAGKAPVKLVPVSEDLEDEDLLEMANAGLIPIVVCDAFILDFWKAIYTKLSAEPEVALASGTDVAWMMRKDSPQLKAITDAFVRTHRKGTAFGNEWLKRYQKGARSVLGATAKSEMRKFNATVELFRKYAGKYEVDYLLMMAQGYQESRLDQKVKSPVGAVGVMQIMPATGQQMRVGDIHEIRAEHPRRREVPATRRGHLLQRAVARPDGEGALRVRLVQRRAESHPVAKEARGEARARPQPLVQERGVRGGREDWAGDRHLRLQHLQVLRRLRPGGAGRAGARERPAADGGRTARDRAQVEGLHCAGADPRRRETLAGP